MSLMRVVVHPADQGGCGHYRLIFPAEALAAEGHDVRVDHDRTYPVARFPTIAGHEVLGVVGDQKHANRIIGDLQADLGRARRQGLDPRGQERLAAEHVARLREHCETRGRDTVDADVVVMQRILSEERYDTLCALQRSGVAVVVEIDDDFHAIHKRNPAWHGTNGLGTEGIHRDWLMRACARADLVTVSTPALAKRYGAHGRVQVIDNYVPARYLDITKPTDQLPGTAVGWSGSTVTHPDDLEATCGRIGQLVSDTGCRFEVVGTGYRVQEALCLPRAPEATGWLPLDDYPAALARLDVGIVPLARHPFNEAKSHLKGLEMAAVGVPFIATPTGPYEQLYRAGIGLLADNPNDWYEHGRRLVLHADARQALGDRFREKVAEAWTVERNAWRWWDAWRSALDHSVRREAA